MQLMCQVLVALVTEVARQELWHNYQIALTASALEGVSFL